MSSLNELRLAGWALGIAVALGLVLHSPRMLPLALAPCVVCVGLLASRRGAAVLAGLREVVLTAAGRLAILAILLLVLLAAIVTNVGHALVIVSWIAALATIAAALASPPRFRDGFVNATLSAGVLAGLCVVLECTLHLPAVARRLGTPQDRARWQRSYDHLEQRNIFRLRSPHETIARTPGVRRIIGIGDSFTWGDKVRSADSVWPSLLERELTRASPRTPTEVINVSHVGWNTVEEAAALNRLGWQFSPDWVIVQFCTNDAELTRSEMTGIAGGLRDATAPLRQDLAHWSALLWVLKRALTLSPGGVADFHSLNPDPLRSFRDDAPGWRRMRGALKEMADSATTRGVPITLVLFPDFVPGGWTPATHPMAPIHRKVAETARALGYDVLDLTEAFAAEGGDWKRWWATAYDGHPGAAAQLVAARAVSAHLIDAGWPDLDGSRAAPGAESAAAR